MRLTPLLLAGFVLVSPGCGQKSDPVVAVQRVDMALNRIEFPKDADASKLRNMVGQIHAIDISTCPPDFQNAFVQLATTFDEFVDYSIETNTWGYGIAAGTESFIRGLMMDPLGKFKEEQARARQVRGNMRDALAHYQRTLAKYKR